jgi:hypothetical protein
MNEMRCRSFVGDIESQQWNRPADYFFAPAAESKSSSVDVAIEAKSIVPRAARKSLACIHYARPPTAINKAVLAD